MGHFGNLEETFFPANLLDNIEETVSNTTKANIHPERKAYAIRGSCIAEIYDTYFYRI